MKPYKGSEPYIFISYAHRDQALVFPVIEELQHAGFRIWYDEGIDPGTEWDDTIASHILASAGMIALISGNYLDSDNCKDELNYARDENIDRLLVYLEEVKLPAGMAMRLNRLQAVHRSGYATEDGFFEKLYESTLLRKKEVQEIRKSDFTADASAFAGGTATYAVGNAPFSGNMPAFATGTASSSSGSEGSSFFVGRNGEISPGSVIDGRFCIIKQTGFGRTSRICLAEDSLRGENVILKLYDEVYAKYTRALYDINLLAKLPGGSHFARIYDTHGPNPSYMSLENVPGYKLTRSLENGFSTFEKYLRICMDLLDALQMLHDRGLYHGDIHPGNVLLRPSDDEVVLIDYDSVNFFGEVPGDMTIALAKYMSPERVDRLPMFAQTDIYSVGKILETMLGVLAPLGIVDTGKRGWTVTDRFLFEETHLTQELLDKAKAAVIRATQKDPADRYSTAAEMRAALADILAGNESRG